MSIAALEYIEHVKDGAFAGVWKVRDRLDRVVAAKVFLPTESDRPGALAHARLLAKVRHARVVVVHEVCRTRNPRGGDDPVDVILMDFIAGDDLERRLRGPIFTAPEARRLGEDVLDALDAIHACGIPHGDLHPGNVVVGADGHATVIDLHPSQVGATTTTRVRFAQGDIDAACELLARLLRHTDAELGMASDAFRSGIRADRSLSAVRSAYQRALDAGATQPPSGATLGPHRWITANTPSAQLRRRILVDLHRALMESSTAWSGWKASSERETDAMAREAEWLRDHGYVEARIAADAANVQARLLTPGRDIVEANNLVAEAADLALNPLVDEVLPLGRRVIVRYKGARGEPIVVAGKVTQADGPSRMIRPDGAWDVRVALEAIAGIENDEDPIRASHIVGAWEREGWAVHEATETSMGSYLKAYRLAAPRR